MTIKFTFWVSIKVELKIEIAQQVTYVYQDFFCERDSLHVGKMICRDFFWLSEHHLAHFMHRSLVLVHSIWSDTTIGMHGCSEWFLAML